MREFIYVINKQNEDIEQEIGAKQINEAKQNLYS